MRINYIRVLMLLVLLFFGGQMFSQNIAVNTSGTAAAATNMFEVTQTSATNNTVGVFAKHTGAATNAYAIWAEATGGTNNYPGVFMGGNVGIGTTTPTRLFQVVTNVAGPSSIGDFYNANNTNEVAFTSLGAGTGLLFGMNNSASVEKFYGGIISTIKSNVAGAEIGKLYLRTYDAATGAIAYDVQIINKKMGVGLHYLTDPLVAMDARGTYIKGNTQAYENIMQVGTNETGATVPFVLRMGLKTDATPANRYGAIEVDDAGTKRNLILQPSGGNVGIGTTTIDASLDIYSSSTHAQIDLSTTAHSWRLRSNSSTSSFVIINNVANTSPFKITSTAPDDLVTLNTNGVGIGTTSPSFPPPPPPPINIILLGTLLLFDPAPPLAVPPPEPLPAIPFAPAVPAAVLVPPPLPPLPPQKLLVAHPPGLVFPNPFAPPPVGAAFPPLAQAPFSPFVEPVVLPAPPPPPAPAKDPKPLASIFPPA